MSSGISIQIPIMVRVCPKRERLPSNVSIRSDPAVPIPLPPTLTRRITPDRVLRFTRLKLPHRDLWRAFSPMRLDYLRTGRHTRVIAPAQGCPAGSRRILELSEHTLDHHKATAKTAAIRRRIPDTTTCTKPLENAYGDWFLICRLGRAFLLFRDSSSLLNQALRAALTGGFK